MLQRALQLSLAPSLHDVAALRPLLTALRRQLAGGLAHAARSPADFAAHQQLLWTLEAMASNSKLAAAPALRALLPAALHELCFRWQAALWDNASAASGAAGPLALHQVRSASMH